MAYKSNAYQYQADEAYTKTFEKIESGIMSSSDTIETLELLEAYSSKYKEGRLKNENSYSRLWLRI